MEFQNKIDTVAGIVKKELEGDGSGHDWWHVYRVWQIARVIGEEEGADMRIVELGALLHDIADYKFHNNDEEIGPRKAREILENIGVDETIVGQVENIVATISFKGAGVASGMSTLEGKVVQDADRLDAIGAIGIARTFAFGGSKGRSMWDPEKKPEMHQTKEAYMNSQSPTINHFYEKLLLLKDRMNTKTAREIAQHRHEYMEKFLEEFFAEWKGER